MLLYLYVRTGKPSTSFAQASLILRWWGCPLLPRPSLLLSIPGKRGHWPWVGGPCWDGGHLEGNWHLCAGRLHYWVCAEGLSRRRAPRPVNPSTRLTFNAKATNYPQTLKRCYIWQLKALTDLGLPQVFYWYAWRSVQLLRLRYRDTQFRIFGPRRAGCGAMHALVAAFETPGAYQDHQAAQRDCGRFGSRFQIFRIHHRLAGHDHLHLRHRGKWNLILNVWINVSRFSNLSAACIHFVFLLSPLGRKQFWS